MFWPACPARCDRLPEPNKDKKPAGDGQYLSDGHQRDQRQGAGGGGHRKPHLVWFAGEVYCRYAHPDGVRSGVNSVSWLLIRFMLVMVPIVLLINGFSKGDWVEASLFARGRRA